MKNLIPVVKLRWSTLCSSATEGKGGPDLNLPRPPEVFLIKLHMFFLSRGVSVFITVPAQPQSDTLHLA